MRSVTLKLLTACLLLAGTVCPCLESFAGVTEADPDTPHAHHAGNAATESVHCPPDDGSGDCCDDRSATTQAGKADASPDSEMHTGAALAVSTDAQTVGRALTEIRERGSPTPVELKDQQRK